MMTREFVYHLIAALGLAFALANLFNFYLLFLMIRSVRRELLHMCEQLDRRIDVVRADFDDQFSRRWEL